MGDLRGSWGPKVAAHGMLLGAMGSVSRGMFDKKYKIDPNLMYFVVIIVDRILDRLLMDVLSSFWKRKNVIVG